MKSLESIANIIRNRPYNKTQVWDHVGFFPPDVIDGMLKEVEKFFDSTGRKQFNDRHVTQYLVETNGFSIRTCGNLTQDHKDFQIHSYHKASFPFTNAVIDYLENSCNIIFTRWLFSIIEPGKKVLPHIDATNYLFLTSRFMVELKSTNYEFFVEEQKAPNIPGEIYEFNNNTTHRGYNPGPWTRMGVVFDYVIRK